MIRKIISGGQTGADQAALDVAIAHNIPHGGWIPKGRLTENGPLDEKYRLEEMPTQSYEKRTEKNILESDGTLILSHGVLVGGTILTLNLLINLNRPYLHLDLNKVNTFKTAQMIESWILKHDIRILNVAGARASEDPKIYDAAVKLLNATLSLILITTHMPDPAIAVPFHPQTIKEAVDMLITDIPLRDKALIAKMQEEELSSLQKTLGRYIVDKFGLSSDNVPLIKACRYIAGKYEIPEDEAAFIIVKALWRQLRKSHAIRIVKRTE